MQPNHRSAGVAWTAASAIAFGMMVSLAKLARDGQASTETMLFIRFFFASILMLAWKHRAVREIEAKKKWALFGMGAGLYLVQSMCFFHGLNHAPGALISILLYLYPAFVAIGAFLVFKEKLSPVKVGALTLAMVGAALAIGPATGGDPLGIVFGVASAVAYSVYILVGSKVAKGIDGNAGTAIIFVGAALSYSVICSIQGFQFPVDSAGWMGCLGLGAISVIALGGFLVGIQLTGAVNASTISALEPITTALIGALLWGEQLLTIQWLGGAVIFGAVIWLVRSR